MRMDWILAAVMVGSFVAGLVIFSRIYSRRPTPRHSKRLQRRNLYLTFLLSCLFLPLLISQHHVVALACWSVMVCLLAWSAFKRSTPKEADANYVVDPRHCGQCGYDLTGNV